MKYDCHTNEGVVMNMTFTKTGIDALKKAGINHAILDPEKPITLEEAEKLCFMIPSNKIKGDII